MLIDKSEGKSSQVKMWVNQTDNTGPLKYALKIRIWRCKLSSSGLEKGNFGFLDDWQEGSRYGENIRKSFEIKQRHRSVFSLYTTFIIEPGLA
jgi:hypothetical protein